MRSTLLTLCGCLCYAIGFCQNIRAHIAGIGNDTVYCMLAPFADTGKVGRADADRRMDTLIARDGVFSYTSPVSGPAVVICIPQKAFYKRHGGGLYLPQGKIMELVVRPSDQLVVAGRLEDHYLTYSVAGSSVDEALASVRKDYKDQDILVAQLEERMDSLRALISDTAVLNRLFRARVAVASGIAVKKMQYVREHPDSELSAYYLCFSTFSPEGFAEAYPRLSDRVRQGIFRGPLIVGYHNYLSYVATKQSRDSVVSGREAPEFSLRTAGGETFALHRATRHSYVVLDFWGTWCGWCMKEMPALKAAYRQYGASVTFVGIACNDNADRWRRTIVTDSLDWTQVLDDGASSVAVRYGVMAYPTKVILDKDLKIVGKFVGADEAFYKKLDELMH